MNKTFVVSETDSESAVSDDSLNYRGSTRSLLTPLYASDYESQTWLSSTLSNTSLEDESERISYSDEVNFNKRYTKETNFEAEKPRRDNATRKTYDLENERRYSKRANNHPKIFTKSWEEWMIEKAVVDLKKIQLTKEEKEKERLAEARIRKEKAEIARKAKENREKWLSQKNFEEEKRRNEIAAQKEYERLKKQQKMELINSKAKKAYNDWLKAKAAQQQQQQEEIKRKRLESRKEEIQRKQMNEDSYKKWKKKNRLPKKERLKSASYDTYDYYDRAAGPEPSYVNPVPWKGLLDARINEMLPLRGRGGISFQSPPLLWKEHEERLKQKIIEKRNSNIGENGGRTKTRKRRSRNDWT